jgi:protein-tyrosine phosphatase
VIDLHSHVLPGLDDGAQTLDDSIALARAAADAGTSILAATPHIRVDHPFDVARVRPAVQELNTTLEAAGIALEVVSGGEVAISSFFDLSDDELTSVCLGDGRSLLVESPYTPANDLGRLARLVEQGVKCSITAASMAGGFGQNVQRASVRMFEAGLVHDVASDAHGALRRPPGLMAGFEQLDAQRWVDSSGRRERRSCEYGRPSHAAHPIRRQATTDSARAAGS